MFLMFLSEPPCGGLKKLSTTIKPNKESEDYFTEMGKALTPQGPDMAAMAVAYKKYNSEILGPPME